jgi:hypothetical protein
MMSSQRILPPVVFLMTVEEEKTMDVNNFGIFSVAVGKYRPVDLSLFLIITTK